MLGLYVLLALDVVKGLRLPKLLLYVTCTWVGFDCFFCKGVPDAIAKFSSQAPFHTQI